MLAMLLLNKCAVEDQLLGERSLAEPAGTYPNFTNEPLPGPT